MPMVAKVTNVNYKKEAARTRTRTTTCTTLHSWRLLIAAARAEGAEDELGALLFGELPVMSESFSNIFRGSWQYVNKQRTAGTTMAAMPKFVRKACPASINLPR